MAKSKIVIIGGGFAGLFTALELAGSADVTLVVNEDHFVFTPMLYEYFSGEVEAWHIGPRYDELLDSSVELIVSTATGIDLDAQTVALANRGEPLNYDVLVLAVGGVTNYAGVRGAEEFSLPFRKIEHADTLRQRMVAALDRIPPEMPPQDVRRELTFALVGAGASGCELSTKMADLLVDAFKRRALHGEPRVMLLEMGDRVVPGMGQQIRELVEEALLASHVEVHTLTRVVSVSADGVTFEHDGNEEHVKTAGVVWLGGVRMNPLVDQLKAEKNKRGLLVIKPTLQLSQHENVFALGDIAFYPDAAPTLHGTAQLAFQQAGLAGNNIKAFLEGKELHSKHFEELGEAISLGTERAAVLTGGKAFGGALARQARFALYTSRLPTWHHRLRVGASWFFGGTQPRPLLPLGLER
ncbi:MAG TPA: NAD(P)/FAD-dependent oxidoreductase [Pyrinomonadaceae bacterium]|nr:NAD(P)/FAD-dependent oxidoreductase [Pyrinomonadaceae bacterium]